MNRRNPERILEFFRGIEDCLLIVEGKRDAKALNTLGLKNILPINGRPLIAIVDIVAELRGNHGYSDIIILTDFDREGRHIAARLSRLLRAHKIHPNQRLRSRIMAFGFNKPVVVSDIGSLSEVVSDKKTGFLVPPKNSHEISKAVVEFFKQSNRTEIIDQIKKERQKFSWYHLVQTIETLGEIKDK